MTQPPTGQGPGEQFGPEPFEQLPAADSGEVVGSDTASQLKPDQLPEQTRSEKAIHEMLSSSWLLTLGAVVLAVIVGGILMIATSAEVREAGGYFFSRPGDFFTRAWDVASSSYIALFQGAVFDWQAASFTRAIRPLTESLTIATPLILAGLAMGVAFRSGLFNIGAQGQVIFGAIFASYIGFTWNLPIVAHVIVAVIGGAVGGAVYAAIPGFLKARTGANEVIVTIMLNNIANYFVLWVVTTKWFASATPGVSKPIDPTARLPKLLPDPFRLNWGFILALVLAVAVWWLMERSTIGFRMRAVGHNARAAKTAGISVAAITVLAMAISGALAGLAGSTVVLGTEGILTASVAGTIGFDSITVALLGRSKPLGTVLAGLLFGALAAGGRLMQTRTGTPLDLVTVLQAIIVLFIAAPPLVRMILRLPAPGSKTRRQRKAEKALITSEKAGAAA